MFDFLRDSQDKKRTRLQRRTFCYFLISLFFMNRNIIQLSCVSPLSYIDIFVYRHTRCRNKWHDSAFGAHTRLKTKTVTAISHQTAAPTVDSPTLHLPGIGLSIWLYSSMVDLLGSTSLLATWMMKHCLGLMHLADPSARLFYLCACSICTSVCFCESRLHTNVHSLVRIYMTDV